MIQAVLTGDIIDSSLLTLKQRKHVLEQIERILQELAQAFAMKYELFRGDSFQIVMEECASALRVALLLRAKLRALKMPDSSQVVDARLSVGLGQVEYPHEQVVISDGEAFRLSGRAFEELGKRTLVVLTPWRQLNEELALSTAFVDEIIMKWSSAQAEVMGLRLNSEHTQKELAEQLERSPQTISRLLQSADEKNISAYIKRFEKLIQDQLKRL